jgi:manganese/zinc/iron transport system permease protein
MLVPVHDVVALRGGTVAGWGAALRAAERGGEVDLSGWPMIRLTGEGRRHARQVVRNHRLWEWYLITHADVAADHVDRAADEIEHVLGEELVEELEQSLAARDALPASPHPIAAESAP